MAWLEKLRGRARDLKRDALTVWFAMRQPDTPLLAKAACALAVGYAFSPIDLIPDFIPVLGYLDDLVLVPALIWLALRLIPVETIKASRERADAWLAEQGSKPRSYAGAVAVVAIWIAGAALAWSWLA